MSWDIILEKPLPGTNVDLFDESSLEAFDLTAVQNCLQVVCPHITETRPLWMLYEERSFEMEFDLAEDFIMLHVHILEQSGEKQFLILLGKICEKLQCRAWDRQTRIRTTTKYRSEANGDLFERRKVPVDSLGCI